MNNMIPLNILRHDLILQELLSNVYLKLLIKTAPKLSSRVEILISLKDICQVLNQEETVVDLEDCRFGEFFN